MVHGFRARVLARAAWQRCVRHVVFLALVCAVCVSIVYGQKQTLLVPAGVAYDSAGDLYFADAGRNQVFEVSLAGTMAAVAGTGEQGFGGEGGPATGALLNAPQGVAVGADGTLYIADTGNHRIRTVIGGAIQTVAGTGTRGNAGDGGLAISASLNKPAAIAVDVSGALLICDTGNHRVRRVDGGLIAGFGGSGVQGFAGDGGAAMAAELDSPSGVAALGDGRVVIADSRNHRIRVVGKDGVISTLAGTGVRGFSGDGGPATAAQLFLPRGVAVSAAGDLIFADSDNHRIRAVNAQGIISTLAGDGWQGSAADASPASASSLNTPRGVAVSQFGGTTFGDTSNRLVREIVADGKVYIVALPQAHISNVTLALPQTVVYGQGTATANVAGIATPEGSVSLMEGAASLGTAKLSGAAASFDLQALSAGQHTLVASYTGDGLNPAGVSAASVLTVQTADVIATANAATMIYGQIVPALTGTETGILARDAAGVSVSFASTAGPLAPVGIYPIVGTLTGVGSANYKLAMSATSGALSITQAQSTVALRASSQTYVGLPVVLNATVVPSTVGIPTGEVDFLEGGTLVTKTIAVNGAASGTFLPPTSGTHVLTAVYAGDSNFTGSTSSPLTVSIGAMPDFAMSAAQPTQSVQAGLIASYDLSLVPVGGPFTGSVAFSISGLPSGAQASFAPPGVVPGASGAKTSLNIQTPANLVRRDFSVSTVWLGLLAVPVVFLRRRKARGVVAIALTAVLLGCLGCGARTAGNPATASRTFALTVTATSTNLAGAVVTHSVPLTLTVQ